MSSARGLSFHDITYEVTQRRFIKKLPNKVILKSVSGVMIPGLNAIMGPTGSGKTTLVLNLDVCVCGGGGACE